MNGTSICAWLALKKCLSSPSDLGIIAVSDKAWKAAEKLHIRVRRPPAMARCATEALLPLHTTLAWHCCSRGSVSKDPG